MQSDKSNFPRIFYYSLIDAKDEVEERLDKARIIWQRLVGVGSEREAHDALQSAVCRDKSTHDDISLGLLANILTDGSSAQKCFRDLNFVTRDNMSTVVDTMVAIAADKYHKLTDTSRSQLIWMVKELVRAGVGGADLLVWNLLRQVAGGDISNRNLWLAENMLEVCVENRGWLEKFPILVGSVIFTYLRILEDHFPPNLASLRQKEVHFVVSLVREHFAGVVMNPALGMGRDFIRLLSGVYRIPEIGALWSDLFYNPKTLSPHFTGIAQLLNIRTSRKFLQCRLTPEMEKKVAFLTNNVKFGMHKRYQEWFQRQFLATQESQTLRADIIRFIVGVIHPPNEILCSDILPRWAVIGWLLTTCTSPVAAANAKLALFLDWLIFDPVRDNIMNIEPGILVMYHSIRPHLAITATLIDFLIRQITEFWPGGSDKIKEGIGSAFRTILEKKVLASLDPVLDNPKLEPELRSSIQESLIPLLAKREDPSSPNNNGNGVIGGAELRPGSDAPEHLSYSSGPPAAAAAAAHIKSEFSSPVVGDLMVPEYEPEPEFSSGEEDMEEEEDEDESEGDEEEDPKHQQQQPLRANKNKRVSAVPYSSRGSPTIGTSVEEAERSKIFDLVQTLPTNLRLPLEAMLSNPAAERGDNLEEIVDEIAGVGGDKGQRDSLVKALAYIYKAELSSPCVDEDSNTLIESNVCASPVVELIHSLLRAKVSETNKRKNLNRVLSDIVYAVPRVGYRILLILQHLLLAREGNSSIKEDSYPALYKGMCGVRGVKLEVGLHQDLKTCWELEPIAVGHIVPFIYDFYPEEVVGSADMLRFVVSTIDSSQLQDIVWGIARNEFIMFDSDLLLSTINKSLDWETWEQHCVWTIVTAHPFEIDDYLPIIPILDYRNNAEALTALFLKIKNEKPCDKLLGPCLCRKPSSKDQFVTSLLIQWSENEKDLLAEALTSLIIKAYGSPVKRKRGGTSTGRGGMSSPAGPATPNIDNVFAHLDLLRSHIEEGGIFETDTMQAALLQVQSWFTDSQKNKYKDLLALAAIEESSDIKETRTSLKRYTSGRNKLPASPTGGGGGGGGGGGSASGSSSHSNSSNLNNNSSSGGGSGGGVGSNSNLSRTRSGRTTRSALKEDDSESSSNDDDEEIIQRIKNSKKRRKTSALNSDSD